MSFQFNALVSAVNENNSNRGRNKSHNNQNYNNGRSKWAPAGAYDGTKSGGSWFGDTKIDITLGSMDTSGGRNHRNKQTEAPQPKKHNKPSQESTIELDKSIIEDFVQSYTNNKTNSTELYSLLSSDFIGVAKLVASKYYDYRYESAIEEMNSFIKLMSTKLFSTTLLTAITDELFDDWDTNKIYVAQVISLTLDTSAKRMVDSTISNYVEIMSEHIYKTDILEMAEKMNISEDAAIDTVIAIPTFGQKMTELQLRTYVQKFLGLILDHSDTMIDTMDSGNQKKFFYYIFPDKDNQATKAVGKLLVNELLVDIADEEKRAIYGQYVNMLYEILDEHDISDIQMVLKFIVKVAKRNKDLGKQNVFIFDPEVAVNYTNVTKALADLVSTNSDAKEVLS